MCVKISHYQLVKKTAEWSEKRNYYPVVTEFDSFGGGVVDVMAFWSGWSGRYLRSYKVVPIAFEIKVSRQDYFRDKQKDSFRRGRQYKVYVTPKGLINISELYYGCGLIEYSKGRFYKKKFDVTLEEGAPLSKEILELFSACRTAYRRKGISKIYIGKIPIKKILWKVQNRRK